VCASVRVCVCVSECCPSACDDEQRERERARGPEVERGKYVRGSRFTRPFRLTTRPLPGARACAPSPPPVTHTHTTNHSPLAPLPYGRSHHPAMAVTVFSDVFVHLAIPGISILAIIFGSWLWWRVSAVRVRAGPSSSGREYLLEEEQRGEDEVRCVVFSFGRGSGGAAGERKSARRRRGRPGGRTLTHAPGCVVAGLARLIRVAAGRKRADVCARLRPPSWESPSRSFPISAERRRAMRGLCFSCALEPRPAHTPSIQPGAGLPLLVVGCGRAVGSVQGGSCAPNRRERKHPRCCFYFLSRPSGGGHPRRLAPSQPAPRLHPSACLDA
jgi:hypothetical protein